MDASELQKLIELMNEHDLLEIEIEEDGKKVRLKKKAPVTERETPFMMAAPPAAIPAMAGAPAAGSPNESDSKASDANTITINSPMVGTFYRANGPDSDPFLNVGDEVDAETVTCIIEAMKVMNEIKAEVTGTIAEILVQNGEPVEFGQPLFALQPV